MMVLTKKEQAERQGERLAFLEKHVQELANEIALYHLITRHSRPQVFVLDADPRPLSIPDGFTRPVHTQPWSPPRPDSFLSEHVHKLLDTYPGMLFQAGIFGWLVGLTLDKERLVFVPDALYSAYEQECLQTCGWSREDEAEWFESIEGEDEETGKVEAPDWPNPTRRRGVWKARQVAHWTGETGVPELDYSVWPNGTWG
ncbi:MAG: hypothetical protein WCD86_17055 [Ktedonobacteraceae bacterium]